MCRNRNIHIEIHEKVKPDEDQETKKGDWGREEKEGDILRHLTQIKKGGISNIFLIFE